MSYAFGTPKLMEWLHNNPLVEFLRIDKVFNPFTIGRNPRFVTAYQNPSNPLAEVVFVVDEKDQ